MKMENKDIKVVHIMSDGKVLDSIEEIVIPLTTATLPVYKLLAEYRQKSHDKVKEKFVINDEKPSQSGGVKDSKMSK